MGKLIRLLFDHGPLPVLVKGSLPAITTILLSSCATDPAPRPGSRSPEDRPTRFHQVATVDAMPSSIPEIFDTGPQIKIKMLELIESAEDYILIDSFLLTTDATSRPVMEALERKHRAGVRIFVVGDSSSRYTGREAGFRFLEDAGIPCVEYNPMRVYKLLVAPVMLPRDHRKFWVIDGKVLFLGGANIIATSLDPLEAGGNHDLMAAVESPEAIAKMVRSFVAVWNASSPQKLDPGSFPVSAGKEAETALWLYDQNNPGKGDRAILEMMDSLFAIAREEVWLVQPYTFVTPGLLKRIRSLTARGVAVNLVLSGRFQAPRFRYASYYGIRDTLQAGGKVWIYEAGAGVLHAKAFVVDARCISLGSSNLNYRSYRLSKEANLVFDDPKSARALLPVLEKLKAKCRPVDHEEAGRYRTPKYFFTWLKMHLMG